MSFLFLISIGFILIGGVKLKEYTDNENSKLVNEFGLSLQNEIEIASVVKDGYQREITLPEEIDGMINYSVSMQSATLSIITDDYRFTAIIPQTIGSLQKGKNTITKNNDIVTITNG